jgi:hypothetical protein
MQNHGEDSTLRLHHREECVSRASGLQGRVAQKQEEFGEGNEIRSLLSPRCQHWEAR